MIIYLNRIKENFQKIQEFSENQKQILAINKANY